MSLSQVQDGWKIIKHFMYYLSSFFDGPYIIKSSGQSLVFSGEASDKYTIQEDFIGQLPEVFIMEEEAQKVLNGRLHEEESLYRW